MLNIFVFLPFFNNRYADLYSTMSISLPVAKTKVSLNHHNKVKLRLNYRLKSQI